MRAAAHHDILIQAWTRFYDDVLVIRHENLMRSSQLLCQWLGVKHIPFPPNRVNESHAGLAALHRKLPFLSAMPHGVKSALKPLTRFLPGKHSPVLSDDDKAMIREMYEASNERTKHLVDPSRRHVA